MPFGHPIKGSPCGSGGGGGTPIHVGDTPPVDGSNLWVNTTNNVGCGWQAATLMVLMTPPDYNVITLDDLCISTLDNLNVTVLPG